MFPCWKYSHFEFVSARDENINVHCTVCAGDKVSKLQKHVKFEEMFGVGAQLSLVYLVLLLKMHFQ